MSEKRVYMPAFLLFVPNVNGAHSSFFRETTPKAHIGPLYLPSNDKTKHTHNSIILFFPRGTIRYGTYMCISNSGQNLSQLGGDWRERNMILHSTCCSFLFSTLCCNSDWNWWGGCVAHLHTHTPHCTSSNNYRVHFFAPDPAAAIPLCFDKPTTRLRIYVYMCFTFRVAHCMQLLGWWYLFLLDPIYKVTRFEHMNMDDMSRMMIGKRKWLLDTTQLWTLCVDILKYACCGRKRNEQRPKMDISFRLYCLSRGVCF